MSSFWCYQLLGEEFGPLTFQELAELVASGTLSEDGLVRREADSQWMRVDEVVGLLRAANQVVEHVESSSTSEAVPDVVSEREADVEPFTLMGDSDDLASVTDDRQSDNPEARSRGRRIAPQVALWLSGLVVIALAVSLTVWWTESSDAFPTPRRFLHIRPTPSLVDELRLPPPAEPSVPGLNLHEPLLVPGCEAFVPAYSPALSADLRTIVFAHMKDGETLYDLYSATRSDFGAAFETPRRLDVTVTSETDAYPTLTPDGRELFYVSSDAQPVLMRSSRIEEQREQAADDNQSGSLPGGSRSSTGSGIGSLRFETPRPVLFNDWSPDRRVPGYPQCVDGQRLVFAAVTREPASRSLFISRMDSGSEMLSRPEQLPFADGWPPYFVSVDGRRAWFGAESGLSLAVRKQTDQPYREPVLIVPASKCGPIEGPIWMAPQEDVVFYVSPGPGKAAGTSRRLWMMGL